MGDWWALDSMRLIEDGANALVRENRNPSWLSALGVALLFCAGVWAIRRVRPPVRVRLYIAIGAVPLLVAVLRAIIYERQLAANVAEFYGAAEPFDCVAVNDQRAPALGPVARMAQARCVRPTRSLAIGPENAPATCAHTTVGSLCLDDSEASSR